MKEDPCKSRQFPDERNTPHDRQTMDTKPESTDWKMVNLRVSYSKIKWTKESIEPCKYSEPGSSISILLHEEFDLISNYQIVHPNQTTQTAQSVHTERF